jgi:hypothetical protein
MKITAGEEGTGEETGVGKGAETTGEEATKNGVRSEGRDSGEDPGGARVLPSADNIGGMNERHVIPNPTAGEISWTHQKS